MPVRNTILNLYPKVIILVCVIVAVSLFVSGSLITKKIADIVENRMGRNAMNVAKVIAQSPTVNASLSQSDKREELDNVVRMMSQSTHLDIVIIDSAGKIRAQLDPQQRRTSYIKPDNSVVVDGKEYTSIYEVNSEYSLHAYSPILNNNGGLLGVVAVGTSLDIIEKVIEESSNIIIFANILGLIAGMIGALFLARNIKAILSGLEPVKFAKIFEERNAVLESVREAVLAVDKAGNITLLNSEARKLLNLTVMDPLGRSVEALVPNMRFKSVIMDGKSEFDTEQEIRGIKVLTNKVPVIVNGEIVGAVATFRDKTEIKILAEQLTGVRNYVEALRSQAHEFMNKLHVILGMVSMECYDELTTYINQIARGHQVEVNYIGSCIHEPVIAGFMLGKLSRAREMGVDFFIDESSYLPKCADAVVIRNSITIIGNLIDNAFDAVQNRSCKEVFARLIYEQGRLFFEVSDTGAGIASNIKKDIFIKGFSTKADNRGFGLALVQESVNKLQGEIKIVPCDNGTKFEVNFEYPEQVITDD